MIPLARMSPASAAAVIAASLFFGTRAWAQPAPTVGAYSLVSSTRVTRTVFDFKYRAQLVNPLPAALGAVRATVTSRATATTVVDGDLSFGDVAANGSAPSLDTFTIRQERTLAFDPQALSWSIEIRLSGDTSALARDRLIDLPPVPVDSSVIAGGVILNRLVLRLAPDASVGQVNAVLDPHQRRHRHHERRHALDHGGDPAAGFGG